MRKMYSFFLKVFIHFFPNKDNKIRLFVKSLILNTINIKRLVFNHPLSPIFIIRNILIKPLKKYINALLIKTIPALEKKQAQKTWSNAWKKNLVYKKSLFLKWSPTISDYLHRDVNSIPKSGNQLPKFCLVARPGSTHFVEPILNSIKNEFEIYYAPFFDEDFLKAASQYDIIWFEWGTSGWPLTQLETIKSQLQETKLVIRIHDFELKRSDVIKYTNWSIADKIIFINQSALKDFTAKHNHTLNERCIFLPNVVNEKSFKLKKSSTIESYNILINCIKLSPRKGIEKGISLFNEIHKKDPRFHLTIRTTNLSTTKDITNLKKLIKSYKKIQHNINLRIDEESSHSFDIGTNFSISKIYHEFDIIWSTSDREGFHYAIAEGMLSGLFPVVRNWKWGQPKDFWEPFVTNTDLEFINRTLELSKYSLIEREKQKADFRQYVINNFGTRTCGQKVSTFLKNLTQKKATQKKAKRIIFFAHNHLYAENPRGGERSSAEVLQGLRSKGYECLVVVQNRKSKKLERSVYENIPVISLPGEVFRLGVKEIMIWWQPNTAMVWEIPTLDIWDICKSRGVPYIIFVRFWHIVSPPPYIDLLSQKQDEEFIKDREPVFKNAHSIISNSINTAKVIEHLYKKKSLISYVPVKKLPCLNKEKKYITLINPNKTMGAEDLIYKIAQKMPDLDFKVIQGSEENSLSSNVHHFPYSEDPYNEIFSDSKIFIFPFKGHPCGTGRVVFECYYLGIPVIGSKSGGLPEVIPAEHIIDSTENVNEWVQKITLVLKNYDENIRLIEGIAEKHNSDSQLNIVYKSVEDSVKFSDL